MESGKVAFKENYTIPYEKYNQSKKTDMESGKVAFKENYTLPYEKYNQSKKSVMEKPIKLNGKKIKPEVLKWIKENRSIILKYRKLKNDWYEKKYES